jgi:hypothetical protein
MHGISHGLTASPKPPKRAHWSTFDGDVKGLRKEAAASIIPYNRSTKKDELILLLEKYEEEQQMTNQTTNEESDAEMTHGISDAETTNEELDAGTEEMTFEESLAECNLDDFSMDAIASKVYDTGEGFSGGDDSGNTANNDSSLEPPIANLDDKFSNDENIDSCRDEATARCPSCNFVLWFMLDITQ